MPRLPKPNCCGSRLKIHSLAWLRSGARGTTWKRSFSRSSKEATHMATIPSIQSANSRINEARSPLARLAAPLAMAAGVVIIVQQLVMYPILDRSQLMATMAHPLFVPSAIAYFVAFCGLLIALVAVYEWLEGRTGALGAIGYV